MPMGAVPPVPGYPMPLRWVALERPELGVWCPDCSLSSAASVTVAVEAVCRVHNGHPVGTALVTGCTVCGWNASQSGEGGLA